jgi:UDP-N-acetylmuramoylalanine--D-glutamate ligase
MIKRRTGQALVLGSGTSGLAAARLLAQRGWRVVLADEREGSPAPLDAPPMTGLDIAFTRSIEGHDATTTDLAVLSPGFARHHPWLAALRKKKLPLIPEFEFGCAFLPAKSVIAVTGSNGKTSFVKWLVDIFEAAGRTAVAAGNIGVPPSAIAASGKSVDVLVLELSSFQLEQSVAFHPDCAVLLNLTPNHLDRHSSFAEYAQAKARLFSLMTKTDRAIVHAPARAAIAPWLPSEITPIPFGDSAGCRYGFSAGVITRDGAPVVDLTGTWWGRDVPGVNTAAALAVADGFGIAPHVLEETAARFIPLPHRMEECANAHGIRFINDSKSSTLSALAAAVATGTEKKHLIAGGILKEVDVDFVKETLVKYCAVVYCI